MRDEYKRGNCVEREINANLKDDTHTEQNIHYIYLTVLDEDIIA